MTLSFACLERTGGLKERLSAQELFEVLNRHFSLQVEAVQHMRGHFERVIGMAVQAFWGPLLTDEDDENTLWACQSALEQLRNIDNLRVEFPELSSAYLSIGISTGRVMVGNLGPAGFRTYSLLGDTVYLAQQLQNVNRYYGTHILLNEATLERAGSAIVCREIDALMVKGRRDPVRIFELLGEEGKVSEAKLLLRDKFSEALYAYRREEWEQAETILRVCLEIAPHDGPSRLCLDRCHLELSSGKGKEFDACFGEST